MTGDPSTVYARDGLSWCEFLNLEVLLWAPALPRKWIKYLVFPKSSTIPHQQGVCRWAWSSEIKMFPGTLVLVSSLYLKKSCYKNGERQNQCLIFSPLFVNWPNKSWRPSNLPKTVTDESFLSIIMNSWLFVRLIVATVANFLTLSLSEAGLLLGLQPLLRWLWVDEGWGSPRCQQCSNKQEGGEGGEGGVRKLQGESVSRRTDWPAVSCCW